MAAQGGPAVRAWLARSAFRRAAFQGLRGGGYEALIASAALSQLAIIEPHTIKPLAAKLKAHECLVAAGALPALIEAVLDDDLSKRFNAASAIGKLSFTSASELVQCGAVPALVQLLKLPTASAPAPPNAPEPVPEAVVAAQRCQWVYIAVRRRATLWSQAAPFQRWQRCCSPTYRTRPCTQRVL